MAAEVLATAEAAVFQGLLASSMQEVGVPFSGFSATAPRCFISSIGQTFPIGLLISQPVYALTSCRPSKPINLLPPIAPNLRLLLAPPFKTLSHKALPLACTLVY